MPQSSLTTSITMIILIWLLSILSLSAAILPHYVPPISKVTCTLLSVWATLQVWVTMSLQMFLLTVLLMSCLSRSRSLQAITTHCGG